MVYHETRNKETDHASASEIITTYPMDGGQLRSVPMTLFGCRNIGNSLGAGGPPFSPHGNHRAVIPFETLFRSDLDYLLPLTANNPPNGRLQQSERMPNNWYVAFLFVKASDLEDVGQIVPADWLDRWRLANHPYVGLLGWNFRYADQVNGRKTWCKILVPGQVNFGTEVRWEEPEDIGGWNWGLHGLTEVNTARIMNELGWLEQVM